MVERSIFWRLGLKDGAATVRALDDVGERGQRAIKRVGDAVAPANRALRALDQSVVQARGSIDGLAGRAGALGSVLGAIGPAGLGAAAGIGAAFVAWRQLSTALADLDVLAKAADRVGETVEALQELRFGAGLAGVAAENLDKGMENLTRRIGDAVKGTGELVPIVQQYGIALKNSDGSTRATGELMGDLAEAIAGTSDEAERARIAFGAFGRSGVELINFLSTGRDGIEAMRLRARELGIVFSDDMARGAERANDAMDELGQTIQAQLNQSLVKSAPLIERMAKGLTDLLVAGRKLGEADNNRAKIIFDAANDPFPQLRGLSDAELQARQQAQEAALGLVRSTPQAFARVAAATGRSLADVERDLAAEIAEIGKRLEKATATALDWDMPLAGDNGIASPEEIDKATERLGKLVGAIDDVAKAEQDRAKAIAELNDVADTLELSDTRRAELLAKVNLHYDTRIKRLQASTEASKAETAAEREAERQAQKTEQRKEQLRNRIDQLAASFSRTEAAAIAYRRSQEDINEAERLGVIDATERDRRLAQSADAFREATAAALGYEEQIRQASEAAATMAAPEFDLRGLFQQSVQAFAGGGFDLRSLGITAASRAADFGIDNLLSGRSPFSGFNILDKLTGISDAISNGLARLAPDIGVKLASLYGVFPSVVSNASLGALGGASGAASGAASLIAAGVGPAQALAITGPMAGAAPAALAAQGLVPNSLLAGAGFSAAMPVIGIAAAGLALVLSKAFGPGKSSGPALGVSFNSDDGGVGISAVGADNKADPAQARSLGDAVTQFAAAFLQSAGARLRPGAFAGELGFESGEFANAISSPGLTEGDRRSGRSPDLKRFGAGEDAAETATADFVVRSFLDAIDRGLVDGLSDRTAETLRLVLSRLEAEGVAKLDDVAGALDFANTFDDVTARMIQAGDQAALQLLDLADGAKAYGDAQTATVKSFKEQIERFFGQQTRSETVAGEPVGAGGRVRVSDYAPLIDEREGGRAGFVRDGVGYRLDVQEGNRAGFTNTSTGEWIEAIRDADGELYVLADAIGAVGDTVREFVDAGDPDRLRQGTLALARYIDAALGLVDADDTGVLTGYALALEEGIQKVAAMREALIAFGLSAEAADAKLATADARLRAKAVTDFDASVADQILSLSDPLALQLRELEAAGEVLIREATAIGGNLEQVNELLRLRREQVTERQRQEEEQRAEQAAAEETRRLVDLRRGEYDVIAATVRAREAEMSALEAARSRLRAFVNDTDRASGDLLLGPNSPLPSGLKLAEGQSQFAAAIATALDATADDTARADARARALELAPVLAELARGELASGPEYVAFFATLQSDLGRLRTAANSELDRVEEQLSEMRILNHFAEQQLSALEAILAELQGQAPPAPYVNPNSQTPAVQSVIADAGNNAGDVVSRAQAYLAANPDVAAAVARGDFGDPSAALSGALAHYRDYGQFEGRAFAAGGDHLGGWRLVGEGGPEIEKTGSSRIHSASQTTSMMRQAMTGAAADGQAIVAAIGTLIGETRETRRVIAAALQQVALLVAPGPTARFGAIAVGGSR